MKHDLLLSARRLAKAAPSRPRQADLRRAVSTAYYALFHALACNAADCLVGTGRNRPDKAWTQVYRSLQHAQAKEACKKVRTLGFPETICECAATFITLQEARHDADYNPDHSVKRLNALAAIDAAESAIENLDASARRDRMAFAVLLLFPVRK